MAIVSSAGTEIIRSAHFKLAGGGAVGPHTLIQGVQHHIYTVLSIVCYCAYTSASNANDELMCEIQGYDSFGGTTNQAIGIFTTTEAKVFGRDTYVWNDKFSFNGYEPVDFATGLDATKQDAIADQGSSVAQKLQVEKGHANDTWDISVTYIDQNNA